MRYIRCSKCKSKKHIRHNRYKELLHKKYGGNKDVFYKNYICASCKRKFTKTITKTKKQTIKETYDYSEIKRQLTQHANFLYQRGIHIKGNRDRFFMECKEVLKRYNLHHFTINVEKNKIKSITIHNIPFLGSEDILL